jgi:hypothetical protein
MTDIALNKSSGVLDIVIQDNALQIVRGDDALRQALEFKLEFFQNDWFLDLAFGIPYYGRVFQRGVNEVDLYGIFQDAIISEPGIESVEDLNVVVDPQSRILRVTGQAFSEEGDPINLEFTTVDAEA